MSDTECAVIKVKSPTHRKAVWLETMVYQFRQAVQLGLAVAEREHTSSRARLHKAVYYPARQQFHLPADYARMAVNAVMTLARSYSSLRKTQRHASFPQAKQSQGIGLGVNAYKIIQNGDNFVLRVSTGKRGCYVWLPLCVPPRYRENLAGTHGDARLFQRRGQWYLAVPLHVTVTPTGCSGEPTFIGVDLGVVRHATVVTPDRTVFFSGKAARQQREHYAALRRRYQAHRRTDRVKEQRGKESRWMADLNHKISRRIVNLAVTYPNPVLVMERLDGIRYRVHGSKRFNRMMSSWTFRDLVDKIQYKARRLGIPVVLVDPRKTSQTCSRCGHATRANRPDQATFRCVACGYRANADRNAAVNIAALGPLALAHGLTDTAQSASADKTGDGSSPPDGVKVCAATLAHIDPNLASSESEPHGL